MLNFTEEYIKYLKILEKFDVKDDSVLRKIVLQREVIHNRSLCNSLLCKNLESVGCNLEREGYIRIGNDEVCLVSKGNKLLYGNNAMAENRTFLLEERKEARLKIMNLLYEKSNGDSQFVIDGIALCEEIGIHEILQRQTIEYLGKQDLIIIRAFGGLISISHEGIREIEESLENPSEPTSHFPPLNIINNYNTLNVEKMNSSQIQQGSDNSNMTLTVNNLTEDKLPQIVLWIEQLKKDLEKLEIANDKKILINEKIDMVEVILLTDKKSKLSIIEKSLNEIKNVLIGVVGNVVATGLVSQLTSILV